jgi:hypothetical protein
VRARSGFSHAELLDREIGKDVLLVIPAGDAVEGGDSPPKWSVGFIMQDPRSLTVSGKNGEHWGEDRSCSSALGNRFAGEETVKEEPGKILT